MPLDPRNPALIERLVMILKLAEKGGLPGKNINLDDMEALGVYLLVLSSNRIDADILEAATPDILSERFFPTPGAIADCCKPHRLRIEEERSANRYKGWIDCLHPKGGDMLAPPEDVRDGHYVPGMGNGVPLVGPTPLEADDSKLKALIEGKAGSPLSLSMRNPHERPPMSAEKEAELIQEARETYERNRSNQ